MGRIKQKLGYQTFPGFLGFPSFSLLPGPHLAMCASKSC